MGWRSLALGDRGSQHFLKPLPVAPRTSSRREGTKLAPDEAKRNPGNAPPSRFRVPQGRGKPSLQGQPPKPRTPFMDRLLVHEWERTNSPSRFSRNGGCPRSPGSPRMGLDPWGGDPSPLGTGDIDTKRTNSPSRFSNPCSQIPNPCSSAPRHDPCSFGILPQPLQSCSKRQALRTTSGLAKNRAQPDCWILRRFSGAIQGLLTEI